MRKFLCFQFFIWHASLSIGQSFGVGYKNPAEALSQLDSCGRYLLTECAELVGVPLDSMQGVEDIFNTAQFMNNDYNVTVAVRSNVPFFDEYTQRTTDSILETYEGLARLERPRFMVFVLRIDYETRITLQMYN